MKSLATIRRIAQRARMACLAVLVAAGIPPCIAVGQDAPKAGDREEVPCGNGLVLGFRFCPAADSFIPLKNWGQPDASVKVKEFWISEMEISQKQYAEIMKDVAGSDLESIKKRLGPQGSKPFQPELEKNFPIYGINLKEGIKFCQRLTSGASEASHGLLQDVIRLPTTYEWQYACREGRDDVAHFNGWPKVPMLDTAFGSQAAQGIRRTIWEEKLNKKEPFLGTEEQLFEMLKFCTEQPNNTYEKAVRALMGTIAIDGLGLDMGPMRTFGQVQENLQSVDGEFAFDQASPTKTRNNPEAIRELQISRLFKIRFLHGNVPEWVVAVSPEDASDPSAVSRIWGLMLSDLARAAALDPDPALAKVRLGVAGGGLGLPADWRAWRYYTTWGSVLSDNYKGADAKLKDLYPGLRVVRMRMGLAADWLARIRQLAVDGNGTLVQMQESRDTVLAYTKEEKQKLRNRELTDFYIALVKYRDKDIAGAKKAYKPFQGTGEVNPTGDRYFNLMGRVLDVEADPTR